MAIEDNGQIYFVYLYKVTRMNPPEKPTILFTLMYKGEVYPVQVYQHQYYSLMGLISEQLSIPGYGLCNGMGSCGTCLVTIRDEGQVAGRSVLACDVRVDDDLANVTVIIPETRY